MTSSGALAAIDIDATPPTFKVIATSGAGAGCTRAHTSGRYIFSLQEAPCEGDPVQPGAKCQIGQLVVLDAMTDTIVKELPLLYRGPGCQTSLLGTYADTGQVLGIIPEFLVATQLGSRGLLMLRYRFYK